MNDKSTALILVAGGQGTRMGGNLPKQYIKINGKQIIEHTISAFNRANIISKMIIVCASDFVEHINSLITDMHLDIPVFIVEGGETRQASVYNGLKLVSDCRYVMIHDAVRCCISTEEILRIADTLWQDMSCALGVRVKDTLKCADKNTNTIISTVDRENLWHIQTPQAFITSDIVRAHEIAKETCFTATDDCALAEKQGISITIVEGVETNLKVTTPIDLLIASQILNGRSQ